MARAIGQQKLEICAFGRIAGSQAQLAMKTIGAIEDETLANLENFSFF